MKSRITGLSFLFLTLIMFIACQPTPNKEIIKYQKEDYIDDIETTQSFSRVDAPEALEEEYVSTSGTLVVDYAATIDVVDVSTYSVYEVVQRQFSDNAVYSMLDALQKEAELYKTPIYTKDQWMNMIADYQENENVREEDVEWLQYATEQLETAPVEFIPETFSFMDTKPGNQYTAYFSNSTNMYGLIYGTKNGNDFCYLRDSELSCYRQDVLDPSLDAKMLVDYMGEMNVDEEYALIQAKAVLKSLGLDDMQLVSTEKLCTYKNGRLISRGWDFVFTHGLDGLPSIFTFESITFGGENLPLPTLCSPWGQEVALVSIDEFGVVCVDLRNIIQYKQRLKNNVKLLSFDELKASITNHLMQTYAYASKNIPNSKITVTEIELCACLVNVKDDYSAGRLIPAWRVQYEYSGESSEGYIDESGKNHPAQTYVNKSSRYFSAIDGSYIEPRITKDMLEQ